MQLHTSPSTSSGRSARRLVIHLLVATSVAVSACGGDDAADSAGTSADDMTTDPAAAATSAPASPGAPAATSAEPAASAATSGEEPAGTATAGGVASVPADICATIPPLEVLNGFVSAAEPLTTVQELPRTPGEAICDVTGDAASNIQFLVLTEVTRESMVDIAANVGATITDLADPALPGGFGYSAVAAIVVDGTYYSVQAIDMDVIMDSTNPQWITRSAELLKLWLPMIGVTP